MSLLHHVTSFLDPLLPNSGIEQPGPLPGNRALQAKTVSTDDNTTSTSSAPAGTITASDFLTLLVTELKNQDPTSDQDPNAYITQLVGVNSLQQLIAINQDLTPTGSTTSQTAGLTGSTSTSASPVSSSHAPAGHASSSGTNQSVSPAS